MDLVNKYKIVEKIITTEDDTILEEIKILLGIDLDSKDAWDSVPASIKQTIEKSFNEIKEGKVIPSEKVMIDIKQKFSKNI